ncbi:hypothetical protein Thena_1621 [Thermodesulfobium narugense DSM 14796]|uniref:Uncharacterized protein n=1 Tax=Thermodesulfobium narugense DSM 14796 TaxID=747365 RepID=M1E7D8_9BACT|nr:hypothetical protein [Thermodesulfobium narugense]AEE15231.1 hypothetical protein Thena_1621 [Thermodesulfobium narugense DSM 14796]
MDFENQLEILKNEAEREYKKLEEELKALDLEIEDNIVKLYESIFGESEEDISEDL